jgi:hypothetical protein
MPLASRSEKVEPIHSKVERLGQDGNLKALGEMLHEFNPFSVLKIDHYEIRHSNMLGWLLHPSENHGLGVHFLEKLLLEIINSGNAEEPIALPVAELREWNFVDSKVLREYKNIDVLVTSRSNRFVLLIENKIRAGLGKDQLQRYWDLVQQEFSGYRVIPVFLTLQGDQPDHIAYYSLSHAKVYELLKQTVSEREERLDPKVRDFLQYYLKLLGRVTMEDKKTQELAMAVYREHRDAIDFILEHAINHAYVSSGYHRAIESYKEQYRLISENDSIRRKLFNEFYKSKAEYWFVPDRFIEKMPILTNQWKSPFMMSYFFQKVDHTVKLHLEVGPLSNQEMRRKWLHYINDHGGKLFSIGSRALQKADGKYTKVRSASIRFSEWEDEDQAAEAIEQLFINFEFEDVNQEILNLLKRFQNEYGNFEGTSDSE